jgi:hypothetical protein
VQSAMCVQVATFAGCFIRSQWWSSEADRNYVYFISICWDIVLWEIQNNLHFTGIWTMVYGRFRITYILQAFLGIVVGTSVSCSNAHSTLVPLQTEESIVHLHLLGQFAAPLVCQITDDTMDNQNTSDIISL